MVARSGLVDPAGAGAEDSRGTRRRTALGPFALVAACVALLSGCSSTHFVREDPSAPIELAPDEGLILLQIDSDLDLERLILTGLVIEEPVPAGRHFWVARMRAGAYSWNSVVVQTKAYAGRYRFQRTVYQRPGELDLTIRPGELNYAGELIVRGIRSGFRYAWISVRIRNHAGSAVRRIEQEYPELLDRVPARNAGTSGDRFLEFYRDERERLRSAATSSDEEASP